MDGIVKAVQSALGLERQVQELSSLNVSVRALVVFVIGLIILRFGNRRFMGKATAFDVLLGVLIGAVLSRAINGSAPFFPTLVGALVIVLLHRGLATLVYFFPRFAKLVEGDPVVLVRDGTERHQSTRRTRITEKDLREALRLNGVGKLEEVSEASLELDGSVSIVPNVIRTEPVSVEEAKGGKKIRIDLSIK
jgi:uncharacterized membrane protein YcaP (DUF421 family)